MKKINEFVRSLQNRLFSNTYQLQRIVILTAIVLGVAVVSFAGYYYYDRYYTSQPKAADVSLSAAEQAVSDDPQNPTKRLALAEVYMVNRRFNDAIAQAEQVMAAYPDNQNAWFIYGVASALNNQPQNAVAPLEKYVEANKDADMPGLNKTLQAAAFYLGDSYLKLGQPDKAVTPLELDVQWSETDADAMYKLGMAYLGVQSYDKAVDMFESATTFVPDYTEAYQGMTTAFIALNEPALVNYARGMEAYSKKDYKTALDLLLKSAKDEPNYPPTFSGLGMVYEALNDLQNAKSSYETALKLNPNDFSASTGLQRVEALLKK